MSSIKPLTGADLRNALPPFVLPDDIALKKVNIWSEGARMTGHVYALKSAGEKKLPTILMASGWGGTAEMMARRATLFAREGYLVVAFDYRGWGESDSRVVLKSPAPSPTTLSFTAEVIQVREVVEPIAMATDWQNAIHWLHGEPRCDTDRIGLWGTSFSGGLTAYVAARDHRVKAVYGQVGAYDGRPWGKTSVQYQVATERARGELRDYPQPLKEFYFEHAGGERMLYGWPMAQQFMEYAPMEEVVRMGNIPLMVVIAEHEELFDNEDNGIAAYNRHAGPKQLVTIPGITHYGIYLNDAASQAAKLAIEWFGKYLKN